MSVRGPWYVSVSAVRDYLRILGRPDVTDGPAFHRAEEELVAICVRAAENAARNPEGPKRTPIGLLQYRGGKPLRLRLLVAPDPREEGRLPQLVSVLPEHDRQTDHAVAARLNPSIRPRPEKTLRQLAEETLADLRQRLPELRASELRQIVELGKKIPW